MQACDRFYYQTLTISQKNMYDGMIQRIKSGDCSGRFQFWHVNPFTAIDDGGKAIKALYYDHPECFFLHHCSSLHLLGCLLTVKNKVELSPAQVKQMQRQLRAVLECLARKTAGLSMAEKERSVYEWVALSLKYQNNHRECDHSIVGALLYQRVVCEGYASLLITALRYVGIPAIRVDGLACGEGKHVWVMAWLNGVAHHLDVTFEQVFDGHIAFRYFALSDAEIQRTHTIQTRGLPVCPAQRR